MLKERIQEVFEFTKSESPYRKANKGWINQDIFLDLSPSSDTLKQKKEAAKVTLLWSPINNLLSNGAKIIDIGGESTRPGSKEIRVNEEISRIIPIISQIRKKYKKEFKYPKI